MIGQTRLLKEISGQIKGGTFPHFCILTGREGGGKKTLAHEIGAMIEDAVVVECGVSAADIRTMVENSYKTVNRVVRIIPDADRMSNEAKNALLKVTEEPPNDVYFIMTLEDISNTLDTIKSRATVYRLENYSRADIDLYFTLNFDSEVENQDRYMARRIIGDVCETCGEVNTMMGVGPVEFYNYVCFVVDNIAEVSGSNSFKIADKLSLKADSDGYDLKLFLKMFMLICIKRINFSKDNNDYADSLKYIKGEGITSNYLRQLGIRGVNKQMLFDEWLLTIRENWMK